MKKFSKKQWIKFSIAAVLYLLFTLWMQNAWLLLGLIVLVDIFLTGYIPWGAWKRTKNPQVRNVLEWVDDILFALVAVYFINIFIFQNYQIPSSSLEKSHWYKTHYPSSTASHIWTGRNGTTNG